MISCNKPPSTSQISSSNISTALSSNMIGCLLEFVKLDSLPTLGKLNKKFNKIIRDEKIFPLFKPFLEERKHSSYITDVRDVFCEKIPKFSYIPAMRNRLEKNYTLSQINKIVTEIFNYLFVKLCRNGELKLYHIGHEENDIKILSDALKINNNLIILILSRNSLGVCVDNIKNLSDALKVNKTLTTLDLSDNDLCEDKENLKNLADALKVNKTLTTLDLSDNKIGCYLTSLKNFSDALKVNTTLTTLNLRSNSLGKILAHFKTFLEALKVNQTLTTLDLSYNHLYISGNITNLSEALKVNKTLTTLDLSNNELWAKDLRELAQIKDLKLIE